MLATQRVRVARFVTICQETKPKTGPENYSVLSRRLQCCSSFQFCDIISLLDRHHSPLRQSKPADACNCDFSRFSCAGCQNRIIILCENYLAGIYFNITSTRKFSSIPLRKLRIIVFTNLH